MKNLPKVTTGVSVGLLIELRSSMSFLSLKPSTATFSDYIKCVRYLAFGLEVPPMCPKRQLLERK